MQQFKYVRFKNEKEILLDFLCRRFPYQDRAGWQGAIDRGALMVDGAPTQGELLLETGHTIGYQRERGDEPPVDRNYRILFEDDDIVVVEKSGNIPIVESGKYYRNTLLEVLKEEEGYERLHQVHRLDRETSGVIVIARSPQVATILGEQFVKGEPKKKYQAVLIGDLVEEIFVDQPIKKVKTEDPKAVRIRQEVNPAGKSSQTKFYPICSAGGLSLVEVELFTGRTHQIRVHAEYIGLPVLGDKLYGQTDERFIEFLKGERKPVFGVFGQVDRQLLHASKLEFFHPKSKEWVTFESPSQPFFSQFECTRALFA